LETDGYEGEDAIHSRKHRHMKKVATREILDQDHILLDEERIFTRDHLPTD
jgi:hypothetical protein